MYCTGVHGGGNEFPSRHRFPRWCTLGNGGGSGGRGARKRCRKRNDVTPGASSDFALAHASPCRRAGRAAGCVSHGGAAAWRPGRDDPAPGSPAAPARSRAAAGTKRSTRAKGKARKGKSQAGAGGASGANGADKGVCGVDRAAPPMAERPATPRAPAADGA